MNDKANKTVITVVSRAADKPVAKEGCLVVIYGMELGKRYSLERAAVIIGRSSKADIQVDQESVSRNHARIINTGKSIILRDMGSTNGTYVNDELIDEYVLKDGDLVKIGRTIFKFLSGGNIESAYHEEIYRLTTFDGLTQVYNRRYFVETLEREMSRAARYRRALSIILFDIDAFRAINETYGQVAGDYVLKQLAAVLRARIRREDILARTGGGEFAVVLPEIDGAHAVQFAEKVRKLAEKTTFKLEQAKMSLTVSIGVATFTPDMQGPARFLEAAQERLQQAKADGRNRVAW